MVASGEDEMERSRRGGLATTHKHSGVTYLLELTSNLLGIEEGLEQGRECQSSPRTSSRELRCTRIEGDSPRRLDPGPDLSFEKRDLRKWNEGTGEESGREGLPRDPGDGAVDLETSLACFLL